MLTGVGIRTGRPRRIVGVVEGGWWRTAELGKKWLRAVSRPLDSTD